MNIYIFNLLSIEIVMRIHVYYHIVSFRIFKSWMRKRCFGQTYTIYYHIGSNFNKMFKFRIEEIANKYEYLYSLTFII